MTDKGYTGRNDSRQASSHQKTVVDFPFDLNNLFNMQYSFD